MAAKFEFVSKYTNSGLPLPERKTAGSAGYDFIVAEDTVIPPYNMLMNQLTSSQTNFNQPKTLAEMADLTKATGAKPTLVPTGVKCRLDPGTYLELSVRSSCPLKYWLILANSSAKIDADYYNNPDNEGLIYFQMINLSPFPILLQKNDRIGQGIIYNYLTTEDDNATGKRTGGLGSTN